MPSSDGIKKLLKVGFYGTVKLLPYLCCFSLDLHQTVGQIEIRRQSKLWWGLV